MRNSSQRGIAGSIRIAAIDIGGGVDGIKEIRADGTVKVTIKGSARRLNWGVDVGIKAGDIGSRRSAPAAAPASPHRSRAAGSSTTSADADHFISDVKKKVGAKLNPLPNFPGTKDDADIELPPHDESTIQGGSLAARPARPASRRSSATSAPRSGARSTPTRARRTRATRPTSSREVSA